MPKFIQNYNIIYNILRSNYEYINIIFIKLYLLNYTSLIILINIIGLFIFLKNLSFEVNITWSIKYK